VTDVVVGVDVGTTGVKALAVSRTGDVVARSEIPVPLDTPRPGWAEQDPEHWCDATRAAVGRVAGPEPAALALSGQMHGLVALDETLRVLRPAILWNDRRASNESRLIEDRLGRDVLIEIAGSAASPGFTAPKLEWMRTHEPEVYGRVARVISPKDLVRLRLTGDIATDVSDASGTLWFGVGDRRWSDTVCAALDVDASLLPEVRDSAEVVGRTEDGVPVSVGAGDQAAAGIGVGAIRPGVVSVVLGTSGVVFSTLDAYRPDPLGRLQTCCHAVPGVWHAMGVMLSAAGSLRWLRGLTAPEMSYDDLVAGAAAVPAGAGGVIFLPYLSGERAPHADPHARAAFLGLGLQHHRGTLTRAVLEGVAYGLADIWQLMRDAGASSTNVRATGGGARSDLWLRILASVLGVPVERTAVDEGSAYGAAILAAVGAGWFDDVQAAVDAWIELSGVVDPEPAWAGVYEEGHARYRAAYPQTREVAASWHEEDHI
jgi:xylulokinase